MKVLKDPNLIKNVSEDEKLYFNAALPCLNDQSQEVESHYVLQLEKKYAKLGMDMLKVKNVNFYPIRCITKHYIALKYY